MARIKESRDHDVAARQRAVRALWLAVQNDPVSPIHDVAVEFYFAVGKLLEGHSLEAIEFRRIDRRRVLEQHQEG
jgi:hypothetical protein